MQRLLPVLLRDQTFTTMSAPMSRDFQVRVGRPTAGEPGQPSPCVLILSRAADRDADELSLRLAAADVPVVRVDSDRVAGDDLSWDPARHVLETREGRFSPRVGFLRYFSGSSVPLVSDARVDHYVRDGWQALARMLMSAPTLRLVNATTPGRVEQLAAASRAGLRVPATVVTSKPGDAAVRIPGDGDLIVKSLGEHFVEPAPGWLGGLFPRRIARSALAAERAVEPAPVIMQEFVESTRELRVYAVGGRFHAFALGKHTPEGPFVEDIEDVKDFTVAEVRIPRELERKLSMLVREWGLDVAAFDLLDTSSGPVFLEVNVACDWLWVERRAGVWSVTVAVTELLRDRFNGALL
jgi:hypothetical protein